MSRTHGGDGEVKATRSMREDVADGAERLAACVRLAALYPGAKVEKRDDNYTAERKCCVWADGIRIHAMGEGQFVLGGHNGMRVSERAASALLREMADESTQTQQETA